MRNFCLITFLLALCFGSSTQNCIPIAIVFTAQAEVDAFPKDYPNEFHTDQNSNGLADACEDFPKIGFNTTDPKTELHLSNRSLYIDNPEKGIIFKSYADNCFIVRIIQNNELVRQLADCP